VPFGSVPERTFSIAFRGDVQGFTLARSRPSWRLCVPCLSVKRPKMIKPPSRKAAKGRVDLPQESQEDAKETRHTHPVSAIVSVPARLASLRL
jgi:hypothetical protein